MRLLKQQGPQCLLYAFAMALEVDPLQMIHFIGHDGMEVWWPEASGEKRLRGFHHQDMIDYAIFNNWYVIMVEAVPNLGYRDKHRVIMEAEELQGRINTYLQTFDGVLTSDKHAVAWCSKEQKCYDPNGYIYGVDAFEIREFFITIRGGEDENTQKRIRRTLQGIRVTNTNETRGLGNTGATIAPGGSNC
jgi:hypothetical protein